MMAATSKELQQLLQVLEARGLPFDEDDVAWAFESDKNQAQARDWVQKHLQPPTLLTRDELAFHQSHDKSDPKPEFLSGRALSDLEVEAAIESLKSSTAAIEKQNLIMEQQKRALQKLRSQDSSSEAAPTSKETRQTKFSREKATLDFEIDQLSQSTSSHLRSSIKQVDATTGSLPASVDRLLEKDDRLLDGLQKLLPKIFETSLDRDAAIKVEQLCSTFSTMLVNEIHARLDKVYKESLLEYNRRGQPGKALSEQQIKQRETQRVELQELGAEIDGLAAIVVDNQYRKPLKQGMVASQAESKSQRSRWAEYTVAALVYLTSRINAISDHIQKLHAHGSALRIVNRTLDEATASEQNALGAAASSTPKVDRSAAKGLKPLRLVQANISEPHDPALAFMREYDVRISETDGMAKLTEILDTAAIDRIANLSKLSRSTEKTVSDTVIQSLARADADLHGLLDAVYAHSDYGAASLVDLSVQDDLETLERQTHQLGNAMRSLDMDEIARSVRNKQNQVIAELSK